MCWEQICCMEILVFFYHMWLRFNRPTQTAFMPGRHILESVLVLHETTHELHRKEMDGVLLKIDFEKAYDKVRWSFLQQVLRMKGFDPKWCQWINSFIVSRIACWWWYMAILPIFRWLIHLASLCDPWAVINTLDTFVNNEIKAICINWCRSWGRFPISKKIKRICF
jgi:hypothetical protein